MLKLTSELLHHFFANLIIAHNRHCRRGQRPFSKNYNFSVYFIRTFAKGDSAVTRLGLETYSLFLAIILWGTILGAIVYSHTVFFPVYLSNLPDSSVVVKGTYALREAPFWTTIHPLLIFSLIATLALNWKLRSRRKLILISFGIYIAVIAVTALYFVPELLAFEQSSQSNLPPGEWQERGHRWQYLSLMRGAIMFIAILPLLISLTKTAEVQNQPAE